MVVEGVRDVGLAGPPHADEIRREQPPGSHAGHDLAPCIGRAGVAVQEDERRAAARILVVDGGVECLDVGHVSVLYGSRGVSRSVARSWTKAFARGSPRPPSGAISRSSS